MRLQSSVTYMLQRISQSIYFGVTRTTRYDAILGIITLTVIASSYNFAMKDGDASVTIMHGRFLSDALGDF
jgi:hypothetical protein